MSRHLTNDGQAVTARDGLNPIRGRAQNELAWVARTSGREHPYWPAQSDDDREHGKRQRDPMMRQRDARTANDADSARQHALESGHC
jgi:hypothetical protein